jgi:hypothetical protein
MSTTRPLVLTIAALAAAGAAEPAWSQAAAKPNATAEPAAGQILTADPDANAPCVARVSIAAATPTWLQVLPERQPPTLSRLSFDERDGRHVEIVWDPYDGRGLARTALLTPGDWQVSFWSEPQRDSMVFANNYAWQARSQRCDDTWSPSTTSPPPSAVILLEERRGQDVVAHVQIALTPRVKPARATAVAGAAPTLDAALSSLRALGSADLPNQAVELVTRVVTRAIKRRVRRLAQRKVEEIVCGPQAAEPRLPLTCAALKGVDLSGLSAAARPVAAAVTRDVLDRVLAPSKVPDGAREALVVTIELLYHRSEVSAADARQLLLTAATAYLQAEVTDAGRLAAQLALRVIAHCHEASPCDAGTIRALLTDPASYFDLNGVTAPIIERYRKLAAEHYDALEQLVANGRRVLDVTRAVSNPDRVRAALRAHVQLVAIAGCFAEDDACRRLAGLRELADHASEGDLAALLRAAAGHTELGLSERARRRLGLLLTVVQQAAAATAGSAEERKLAVGQIEAALDAYLDHAVERQGREGDWIYSLGIGLRAHAAVKFSGSWFRGPASAPVALSLDRLCDGKAAWCRLDGLHLEVGFLDLGNYLRIRDEGADGADAEPVDWTDVANLSVGAGYLFGNPDLPCYVGATAGLAPGSRGADDERGWNLYAGVFAGAYLPLIDFN